MITRVTQGRAFIVAAAIVCGMSITVSVRQAAAPEVAAPTDPLLAGFARSTVGRFAICMGMPKQLPCSGAAQLYAVSRTPGTASTATRTSRRYLFS